MMLKVQTFRKEEFVPITDLIVREVQESKVKEGLVNVFVPHATAGLVVNENDDPNVCFDVLRKLAELIPEHDDYLHDRIDDNAAAHIKASLFRPDLTLQVSEGRLLLGRWQAVMLAEFDGPKERSVSVKIIKEK